jgi:uncharacterized RDD family membrane protein YckC
MAEDSCPKCQGPRDAKALYCPFCGVVYSRFIAGAAIPPPPPVPAPAADLWAPRAAPAPVEERSVAPEPIAWELGQQIGGFNPYRAPNAPLLQDERRYQENRATRGERLRAQMVNGFVVAGGMFALMLLGIALGSAAESPNLALVGVALGSLWALGWMIYNVRLLAEHGQSIGKRYIGIKVVSSNGEPATLGQLILRRYILFQLLGLIPYLGALIGLVDVLMIFGEEQRCLHDRVADTIVVKA